MNTNSRPSLAGIALLVGLCSAAVATAQELHTKVTYLCNGERLLIESCNMRDQSDTSTCLVQHPDRPKHNGFVAYTNETRGSLKKLLATCTQPTADEVAHAEAFAKKQQDKQDAILQQNLKAMDTPVPPPGSTSGGSSKSQRDKVRVARCLSAGRTEGQCVGNEFGKAFQGVFDFAGSMLGMKPPQAGLYLNGIYEGKGGWNIQFAPDSVAMQCSDLVTDDHPYKIEFKGTQVTIKVETKPEPLVLAYREGKLYGSAPIKVDGAIVVGTVPGSGGGSYNAGGSPGTTSHTETSSSTTFMSPQQAEAYQRGGGSGTMQQNGAGYDLTQTTTTTTYSAAAPAPVYNTGPRIITAPRTRTCAAPALATTKTATSQDMGSAVSGLGALFGGGEAPKATVAPTGLRMFGEYASPGGVDIDFKDDVAIVACGMIAAQYPYAVDLSGKEPILRFASSGKPTIDLSFGPDRTLIGTGNLQVSGRAATGEDRDGNIAYTSRSASCALGTLKPVSENSDDGSAASVPTTSTTPATGVTPAAATKSPGPAFSKPSAPTGNAVLSVASGFSATAGAPNPLAGRPYLLLRDNLATVLSKAGAAVPAGVSAHKVVKDACASQTPDCRKYLLAISADAATGLASDVNGKVTLPGVPPGIYYLMVSNPKNTMYWELKLQLKTGPNSTTLDQHNAVPLN